MGLEDAKNIPKHVLMKSLLSRQPPVKRSITITRSTQTDDDNGNPPEKQQESVSPQKRVSDLFAKNKETWDKTARRKDCGECCQCNCAGNRKRQEVKTGKDEAKQSGGNGAVVVSKDYVKQQVKKLDSERRRYVSKFCCNPSPAYNSEIVNLMECIRAKLAQEDDKRSESSYTYDDGSEWSSSCHGGVDDPDPISFPKETRGAMERLLDNGACTSRHQNYCNLQMSRSSDDKVPAPPTWPGMATRVDCHSKNQRSKNSDKCVQ